LFGALFDGRHRPAEPERAQPLRLVSSRDPGPTGGQGLGEAGDDATPGPAFPAPSPPDDDPRHGQAGARRPRGWRPGPKAYAHLRTTGPALGVEEGEPPST
jgi:hypothetical protein